MPDPYSAQIDRLRSKLGQKGGPSNQDLRGKIQKLQGRDYFYDQRHQPDAPIPYSGTYDATAATALDDHNQTTADIAGQRLALDQRYGITDTSNPYSLARQLENANAIKIRGTTNSMAASGQLYAGSTQNAQNTNRQQYGQAQDDLLRQYQADQANLTSQQTTADRTYRDTVGDAEAKRLEDALNNPVDPTTVGPMPDAAKQLLQNLRQRATQAKKQGKDNKAQNIQDRLRRLQGAA